MSLRVAVFGYGSLVARASASATIGREIGEIVPARLGGWKRRWSQARDNLTCEKTFELEDGTRPEHILGLNVERGEDPAGPVNGVLVELAEAELDRLDVREIRYDRAEVTGQIATDAPHHFDLVVTYTAKDSHLAPDPPQGAVILETYATAVERAFEALGPGEREHYDATTGPCPVPRVPAQLVIDRIPAGNPRDW